ncbi:unnamed protein product [Moneuplotes crassus]|uniref:Uncharacterized protein n=1 Tax=Euplotes crassus TaxID=5936 RepID=A0AAD1UC27_EUPCR|nr:unnamed protein product [Moneuplotes crassus]
MSKLILVLQDSIVLGIQEERGKIIADLEERYEAPSASLYMTEPYAPTARPSYIEIENLSNQMLR